MSFRFVTTTFYAIVSRLVSILHRRLQNRRHFFWVHTNRLELITTSIWQNVRSLKVKRSDVALRRFESTSRMISIKYVNEVLLREMTFCFARWHFQIFILWKCFKQSLNETSFLSFLMKFFKCHWLKELLMIMFMKSLEVHSSDEEMNFESRENMSRVKYETNLNIKKFLSIICLYRVWCSIIKEHRLITIIFVSVFTCSLFNNYTLVIESWYCLSIKNIFHWTAILTH